MKIGKKQSDDLEKDYNQVVNYLEDLIYLYETIYYENYLAFFKQLKRKFPYLIFSHINLFDEKQVRIFIYVKGKEIKKKFFKTIKDLEFKYNFNFNKKLIPSPWDGTMVYFDVDL